MTIIVRYFASIREDLGRTGDQIESGGITTAADVWARAADAPWRANTLVAINQEHARPADSVQDGDEVAFFPPITGG